MSRPGPATNPDAIGASLRIVNLETSGPCRLISAGSGYGSHNAFAQVLSRPGAAATLEVLWPDGTKSSAAVSPEETEIRVRYPAK